MTKNFIDISSKIDDKEVVNIFSSLSHVASLLKINFFIIGATARDIILEYGFNVSCPRATRDIDLGVQISSWENFQLLKEKLIQTNEFNSQSPRSPQRLLHKSGIPIDLVPFGKIGIQHQIIWPPDDAKMSILGFDEAYTHSMIIRVQAKPIIDIHVANPANLSVLKIISWKEKYPERKKDAIDLAFILRNYINTKQLDSEYTDLLEDDAFDYLKASARILGRDASFRLSSDSFKAVLKILQEETAEQNRYPLIEDMSTENFKGKFEENLALLIAFKQGLEEGNK